MAHAVLNIQIKITVHVIERNEILLYLYVCLNVKDECYFLFFLFQYTIDITKIVRTLWRRFKYLILTYIILLIL